MNQISKGKLEVPQLLGDLCNIHHSKLPSMAHPPMMTSMSNDVNNMRPLSVSISSNDQLSSHVTVTVAASSTSATAPVTVTAPTATTASVTSHYEQGPYLEGAAHSLSLNTRVCTYFFPIIYHYHYHYLIN
jgi:hypothetical protein